MLIASWFLCGMLYAILYCYLFSELVCEEKFEITMKFVIYIVVFAILYSLIMHFNSGVVQPYLTNLVLFIILKFAYKKKFVKTILCTFLIFIAACLSELIYDVIVIFILNLNMIEILKIPVVFIISNIIILLLTLGIFKIKFVCKFLNNIISWYNENDIKNAIIFVLLAMVIGIFLMYNNFIGLLPNSLLWITNLFCICVMVFVIGFFKEKSNNNRIMIEYDNLLNYVKVYENEIEEKSKNQHEYKNQLIVIKSMLGTKNKKIVKYIDDQLESEKGTEDKSWLSKLKYVPQGGLKGLIYYKIQEMLKKDIKVFVDVSPQLKEINIKNISKNLEDISKIIGIYLDNAIEAVKDLKDKYIIIEIYLDNKDIVFSLSNNYNGIVDISKLDKEGYTTKGNGHGYGLSLVKDIISKNNKLSQKRELNGIYYVQKLYIKK